MTRSADDRGAAPAAGRRVPSARTAAAATLLALAALVIFFEPARAAETDATGFRRLCAEQVAAGDSMAVAGQDDWLFLRCELRHIGVGPFWGPAAAKVSQAASAGKADPLPAIVDFNDQLEKLGIELILMPVPCKALIYPEKLDGAEKIVGPKPGRLDTAHRQFYELLGEKGVTVLDLAEMFLKETANTDTPRLYCKTDTHWSPYACRVAARAIKERLGSPAWIRGEPARFETKQQTRTISGDLAKGKATEQLPARAVSAVGGGTVEDKASPIVVLGDSHTLVFHAGADMQGTGAGLADQMAAELGLPIDVIGVRGSGATPARVNLMRRARGDSKYLAGKKVVVWCFAAREFTESTGWTVFKLVK